MLDHLFYLGGQTSRDKPARLPSTKISPHAR